MRFGRCGSALAAIALTAATSHCGAFPFRDEPTYRSLRQLVESRHVRSISALLADLPESYVSHHALLFESRSPQEASFRNPRAIVYGADATFVIAFNGSSDQRGFSSLDTMEFDRERANFVFREIVFPEGMATTQPQFSEDNPPSCSVCHGSPPRPIWDAYPVWPGAYGERADGLASEPERLGLAEYETNRPNNPRYATLIDRPLRAAEAKALAYHGARPARPNVELGSFLSLWNSDAVVRGLLASQRVMDYRYALLASFAGACAGIETIPPIVERSLPQTYIEFDAAARRAYERQQELKSLRALRPGEPLARTDPFALNRFRYVAEVAMGAAIEPWSIAFERGAYDSTAPGFASLFVERASAQEPELRRLLEMARTGDCRELQSRSLVQLRATKPSPLQAPSSTGDSISSFASAGRHDRGIGDLLGACNGCHQHGAGPPIPFDDRAALPAANRQSRYPRGSLLAEILFRLRPEAGARRMPLGTDLTKGEAASLEAYFRSAVKDDRSLATAPQ